MEHALDMKMSGMLGLADGTMSTTDNGGGMHIAQLYTQYTMCSIHVLTV
jgi:hypothetical protein